MIISCPSCQKRYLVDEAVLSEQGHEVRCGVCGMTWVETLKPAAIPISTLEIDTVHAGSFRTKKPPKTTSGIFLFLSLLTVLITAFYMARFSLIKSIPVLKPIYEALGVHSVHPTQGLHLSALTPLQTVVKQNPALIVKGVLSNTALEAREISEITITLYGSCKEIPFYKRAYYSLFFLSENAANCPVDQWRHRLSQTRLMPGESLAFETHARAMKVVPSSLYVEL